MKRNIYRNSALAVVVTLVVLYAAGLFMLNYSLKPLNRGKDIKGSVKYMMETYPQIKPWYDSVQQHNALRDTFITSPDGKRLHALYARSAHHSKRTAVIVHGYTDNAVRMLHIGYMYNNLLDYNILLPDLRYTGLSEGDAIQMGWLDRIDVMQWIKIAPALFGDSIAAVVHGISMGGATTMMVSGEELPQYIKCFVDDCGYTSVWDQFGKELKEQFFLPEFPLLYIANSLCDRIYGWNFKEASALEQVKKCKRPMLFIHGDQDRYVPTSMVYQLHKAKPEPKELWITPNVKHARSYLVYPDEYTRRTKAFTEKYIN